MEGWWKDMSLAFFYLYFDMWIMYMQVYHSEVLTYSVLQFSLQHKIFARLLTNVDGASLQPQPNLSFLSSIISFTQKLPHGSQKSAPSEWNLFYAYPDMTGGGRWPWLIGCGIGIWLAIKFRILSSRTKHMLRNFHCANQIARHFK